MESLGEIDQILTAYKFDSTFNFNKFIDAVEKTKSDIYLQLLCYLYEHKPYAVENVEACKLLSKYKELNNQEPCVDELGSPIQRGKSSSLVLNEKVVLSSPSRSTIFKPVDNIINMMEIQEFNLDDENLEEVESKIKLPLKQTKNPNQHYEMSTQDLQSKEMIRMPNQREFKEKSKNITETPSSYLKKDEKVDSLSLNDSPKKNLRKQSSIIVKSPEITSKGSVIFKITENGNLKPYYLLLCNKDIYYYKSEKCKELLGMHNLSGCYIEDFNNASKKCENKDLYAFSVIFSNKTRTYYTESAKEAEEWISLLKKAIGYQGFNDIYDMQSKTLGEGKFGLVKLGIHKKTGEKVAIKIIKKEAMTPKDQELVKSEIDIMKMCRHPNVVRLLDHFENNEFIFIVMEYLAGGTFAHYLESTPVDDLSEKQTAYCTYQIALALEYLHQFGIIHRDLKPENIMIKSKLPFDGLDSLKVMDFGLSKVLGPNERVNDGYGTLTYVAPEVLTRKPYNKHVDVWSLGVIVYYTLSGTFPFDDASNDEEVIAKKTVFNELKFSHKSWTTRTSSSKDFIQKAMAKDMEKRAKIGELLNHQWFIDSEVVPKKKKSIK